MTPQIRIQQIPSKNLALEDVLCSRQTIRILKVLKQLGRLNASEKEIVAKRLAEFITALHATPKSVIKKFHVKSENQQELHKELVRDTKNLLFPRLRKEDVRLIEQYFVELKAALDRNFTNALVHNDLTGEHILWDAKNKQINIIDFSDRAFGDPASDFTGFLEYGLKPGHQETDSAHRARQNAQDPEYRYINIIDHSEMGGIIWKVIA